MSAVVLYLYDLSQGLAAQFSPALLGKTIEGIWHTGVVVFQREYYYGGGIQWAQPGQTVAGTPLRRIELGTTHVTRERLHAFLAEISHRFTPQTYSLLRHNCNNFSNELSLFLTGNPIPAYITGLPEEAMNTPIGAMIIPMIEQFENQMRSTGGGMVPWNESGASSSSDNAAPALPVPQPTPPSTAEERNVASEPVLPPVRADPHPNHHLDTISTTSKPLMSVDANAALFHKQMSGALVMPEEERLISDLVSALSSQRSPSSSSLAVFKRLVQESQVKQLFPVLALLRLAAAHQSVAFCLLAEETSLVELMLARTIGRDGDDTTPPAPLSVQIMSLCVLSNLVSHLGYAHDLAMSETIASSVLRALRSPTSSIRMMGATVAYNCSLHLRFDSPDAGDRDDVAIQYISALAESLPKETDAQARYRGLLALGHLVYFMGTEGSMLLEALGFDGSVYHSPATALPVAADIMSLLKSSR